MDARLKDALRAAKGVLVEFDDAQLMELLKAYSPAAAFPQNGSPTDSGVDQ